MPLINLSEVLSKVKINSFDRYLGENITSTSAMGSGHIIRTAIGQRLHRLSVTCSNMSIPDGKAFNALLDNMKAYNTTFQFRDPYDPSDTVRTYQLVPGSGKNAVRQLSHYSGGAFEAIEVI